MGVVGFVLVLVAAAILLTKALADPVALRSQTVVAKVRGWLSASSEERGYLHALRVCAVVAAPVWAILIVVVGVTVFRLFAAMGADTAEALRWHTLAIGTMLLALAGLVGAPLSLIRVWTAERQTHTIEQGHVTDRLTKAIEQLGAEKTVKVTTEGPHGEPRTIERTQPNLEVRLGAIYALERIAQDSERDHIPVMETLCAYIRENAPASEARNLGEQPNGDFVEWVGALPGPRADVQAALHVIGRRSKQRIGSERSRDRPFRLDLRRTSLQAADLSAAHLDGAILDDVRLEGAKAARSEFQGASLRRARLEKSDLGWARLDRADFEDAHLTGADLHGSNLEWSCLRRARLQGANLDRARMAHANLGYANLSGSRLTNANLKLTDLRYARFCKASLQGASLEAANLCYADFRGASLYLAKTRTSHAEGADFRSDFVTQSQLDAMVGNNATLLPDRANERNENFTVWTCWVEEPSEMQTIVDVAVGVGAEDHERAAMREELLCSPGHSREKAGTLLAADAPYPQGHNLARLPA